MANEEDVVTGDTAQIDRNSFAVVIAEIKQEHAYYNCRNVSFSNVLIKFCGILRRASDA